MANQKTVLLLDSLDRGTIQTSLQTNNYIKKIKLLNSSVKNWESICKILEEDDKIIVIGKFTEYTLFKMCIPKYETVVSRLLNLLIKKKHLIFIYKENLIGNFSYFKTADLKSTVLKVDNKDDYFYYREKELDSWLNFNGIENTEGSYIKKVRALIGDINNKLNVLPYEKLIDIEISGQNFIENIAEGLLFRIYIPNERIWSNEFDKFITLFRDYASNVSNKELKIIQNRTDLGIICSLYSINKSISEKEINNLYKEFSVFMDLCSSNPKEAEKLIDKLNVNEPQKQRILKKYIKESQRLLLDIKQEREIKLVTIKHKLENELQEFELSQEVIEYVENSLPNSDFTDKLTFGTQIVHNQTININPQIIHKVDGVVCNELNGNLNFSPEEQEIGKLIEKFSKSLSEKADLQSSLYELKDIATSKENKRGAWQKLYGFLGKVGDKVGDVGISLLTKYIEQQMKM